MVDCKKCNSEMRQTYTDEQVKKIMGNQNNPRVELDLKRSFTCDNCGIERKISQREIVKEFVRRRKEKGKSTKEITKEVDDKIKEISESN